jgi:hypothetical protein
MNLFVLLYHQDDEDTCSTVASFILTDQTLFCHSAKPVNTKYIYFFALFLY